MANSAPGASTPPGLETGSVARNEAAQITTHPCIPPHYPQLQLCGSDTDFRKAIQLGWLRTAGGQVRRLPPHAAHCASHHSRSICGWGCAAGSVPPCRPGASWAARAAAARPSPADAPLHTAPVTSWTTTYMSPIQYNPTAIIICQLYWLIFSTHLTSASTNDTCFCQCRDSAANTIWRILHLAPV